MDGPFTHKSEGASASNLLNYFTLWFNNMAYSSCSCSVVYSRWKLAAKLHIWLQSTRNSGYIPIEAITRDD